MPEPNLRITLEDGKSYSVVIGPGDPESHLDALLKGRAPYDHEWIPVEARGRHFVNRSAVVHIILTGTGEDESTDFREL
jgi:hypothetical protein